MPSGNLFLKSIELFMVSFVPLDLYFQVNVILLPAALLSASCSL